MPECKSTILRSFIRFQFALFLSCLFFAYLPIPSYTILSQSTRFGLTLLVDHSEIVTEDDVQQPRATRERYSSCLILRRREDKEHSTFITTKTSNALVAVKNKRTFNDTNLVDFDESLMEQYLISKPVRKKKACTLKDLVEFMQQILKCVQDRSSHPELFCQKRVLKHFLKLTGKHLCQSLFLIMLQVSNLQLY